VDFAWRWHPEKHEGGGFTQKSLGIFFFFLMPKHTKIGNWQGLGWAASWFAAWHFRQAGFIAIQSSRR